MLKEGELIKYINYKIFSYDSPVWSFGQQIIVRGGATIKFLLLARLLDVKDVGIISLGLVIIAIVESLTDFGLPQSILNQKDEVTNEQFSSLWNLTILRGFLISLMVLVFIFVYRILTPGKYWPDSMYLISILPIIRGFGSSGALGFLKARLFRKSFALNSSFAVFDIFITVVFVISGLGASSVFLAMIISELFRTILSHYLFRQSNYKVKIFNFSPILSILNYGSNIWKSNIVVSFLNQFDKILLGYISSASSIAYYQMSGKISQAAFGDPSYAISQYLMPVFAKVDRDNHYVSVKLYIKYIALTIIVFGVLAVLLKIFSHNLIILAIGSKWLDIIPLLSLTIISGFMSCLILMSVGYAQATGSASLVLRATSLQAGALIIVLIINLRNLSVYVLAQATALAAISCFFYLYYLIIRSRYGQELNKRWSILNLFAILSILIAILPINWSDNMEFFSRLISLISLCLVTLCILRGKYD